ncbi:divalent-cation tolerance protein CutA [Anopheles darlingi]|uniref:divalent-cation tolerance protein CutA n=1 Tax=Anopheles darlingi TaxID=43151 RepID=UPI00210048F9|nr:divalent-cation tolerance protein CutA [Anopheles darlingi]
MSIKTSAGVKSLTKILKIFLYPASSRRIIYRMSTNESNAKTTTEFAMVQVSFGDEKQAALIARILTNERLAACVHVVPNVTSYYIWNGKSCCDPETLLKIKTRASRVDDIARFIRKHHHYDVPEIVSFPIHNGDADYLNWIETQVSAEPNPELLAKTLDELVANLEGHNADS